LKINGFDWDDGNAEKNLIKHGITCQQIEELFQNSPWVGPDVKHSSFEEERFLAIGQIDGRYAFVAFAMRTKGKKTLIRPISARFMHVKEIKKYEEEIKKDDDR
jgi:uncharacterized DUF497 family protein